MTVAKEVLEHIRQKELQQAMENIKPCPFCGGWAELLAGNRGIVKIVCKDCHCRTEEMEPDILGGEFVSRYTEVIETWNRRTSDGH